MARKNPAILNTIALISLAMFGYLLFFTVYRQMINQNEGFFYVLVFGGVLILAFILLSLMTKLLAFSSSSDDSVGLIILEILFLLTMSVLFVKLRVTYGSSVPEEESIVYHIAQLMQKGTISIGGGDILPQMMRRPAAFLMGAIVSVFLSVSDAPGIVIYLNTGLLLACSLLSYGIVRRIGSRICALFVFFITLYMPSLGFAVYSYDAQILFAFMLLLAMFLTVIPMTQKKTNGGSIVSGIFAGIVWGLVLFMEPVSILILVFVFLFGRIGNLTSKLAGIIFAIALGVVILMIFVMSITIDQEITFLLGGIFSRFNPFKTDSGSVSSFTQIFQNFNEKIDSQLRSITDNYYFLSKADGTAYSSVQVAWMQLGSQVLYMFLLILSIACAFYMIRSHNARIMPILSAIVSGFLMIFLSAANEYNIVFYLILIIMTGGISLQYMYENHHALADENMHKMLGDEEEAVEEVEEVVETEEDKLAFIQRAQALIFIGMNEEYYKQIKLSEARLADQKRAELKEQFDQKRKETSDGQTTKSEPVTEKDQKDDIPKKDTKENTKEKPVESPVEKDGQEKEIKEKEIKEKENTKKDQEIEYLESPLPLPKKHTPKDLDYDRVDLKKEDDVEMNDFDLSEDDNWDFDIDEDV